MNLNEILRKKAVKYIIFITGFLSIIYIVLRLTVFETDPVVPLLSRIYRYYLYLPENLTNLIFRAGKGGVLIRDHTFIFEIQTGYQDAYAEFLSNWPRYLLYRTWSLLILVIIWGTITSTRKKLIFSMVFILAHIIAVISGLYLLGVTGPAVYEFKPKFFLSPTLIGTLIMYILLATWLLTSKDEILFTIQKSGIKIKLADRKMYEILGLFLFFLALRSFIIPFFEFKPYVNFLLETTRSITVRFGQDGIISGDQLIGENGTLAVSKHCLGFMSMFLFASMVYLTRISNKQTWIYIITGLIFLLILNITRLILLFIMVQGEDGVARATYHHEIYNMVIYVIIFVMWIVWFEFFLRKRMKKGKDLKETGEKLD